MTDSGVTPAGTRTLAGAGATALRYRVLSTRLRWWSVSAAVLAAGYAVFSLTPMATTIAGWMMD